MMPKFYMHISDGKESEIDFEARDAHDALNTALNALSKFACKAFPPPDNVAISIMDDGRNPVAEMAFAFTISYAPGIRI